MDANRDEAIRCLKIAEKHLSRGNISDCKRFVSKAKKLYPNLDVSKFSMIFDQADNRERRSKSRERRPPSQERKSFSSPFTSKDSSHTYTKSQTDPIRKILATKDHYEILGVPKNASEDDIKKAYKLLARKYHPDKNTAPGATEAFKKIGSAMDVLMDPAKRKRYDQFGNEDEVPIVRRRTGDVFYQYETHQAFDADIFNMFFNGGFPFGQFNHGPRQRARHAQNHESERESNYFVYLQLLPLIILFALSFFSSMMVRDPNFSLVRTQKYPNERTTDNYQVPYFVKPNFPHDYDGSIPNLERQVEEEYVSNLRLRCYREKDTKEQMMYRARYFNDQEAFDKAQRSPVPSCDRLSKMFHGG